jgi:predicted enzyme related to lactoylglutathione lyase
MRRIAPLTALALGVLATLPALAAAPATSGSFIKYVQTVADMNRSYAFYRALGMEGEGPPASGKQQASVPMVTKLTGSTESMTFRNAYLKIPGTAFQFEFTEFGNTPREAIMPRMQDPGASLLILRVRNLNTALDAAKGAGAKVVTLGGAPLKVGPNGGFRSIFVKDAEGYFVELQELTAPPADAPAGNLIGGAIGAIVADADKAAAYYHEQFGLEVRSYPPSRGANELKLAGLARGEVHRSVVTTPGNPVEMMFISFSGAEQHAYLPRITDPGAAAWGFAVGDLDAGFSTLTSSGGKILSGNNEPIRRPNGGGVGFVRDPFGLALEVQQPSPPAPAPASR